MTALVTTWKTTIAPALQWMSTALRWVGLLMAMGLVWPLCHAHRIAVPVFRYLKVRAQEVHDQLQNFQGTNQFRR